MRYILFAIALFVLQGAIAQKRKTTVSIKGEDFYINDSISLKGKTYKEMRLQKNGMPGEIQMNLLQLCQRGENMAC
jgi:hypothetical protein